MQVTADQRVSKERQPGSAADIIVPIEFHPSVDDLHLQLKSVLFVHPGPTCQGDDPAGRMDSKEFNSAFEEVVELPVGAHRSFVLWPLVGSR